MLKVLVSETEEQNRIQSILERKLSLKRDKKTIRKAPDNIKTSAGDFGDLRTGQTLFTSDPEGDVLIYTAWWQWGDGEAVSVSIASPDKELDGSEKTGLLSRLKNLFS